MGGRVPSLQITPGGGGYFLLIGLWVCASGRGRFFTDGLTIIGLHFHESC